MSRRDDGTIRCDRCGAEVGNGGALYAVTVSGFDPDDLGVAWQLHLCLPREEESGPIPGCRDEVLDEAALRNYHESRSQ
jgi:hypothetical protein